ncbi:hypothetical protein [Flaviaesturariibacter terrae]
MILFFGCNHIETQKTLSSEDIKRIESLKLLEKGERIEKFYSEYRKSVAGNFYTDRRFAKYWIDEHDKTKNEVSSARYSEVVAVDTVFNAGATYTPFLRIKKRDSTSFKLCVDGSRNDVRSFFEGALAAWRLHTGDSTHSGQRGQ